MQALEGFSFEELRVSYYRHGCGVVSRQADQPTPGFDHLTGRHVAASLPVTMDWKHASCLTPTALAIDFGSESVTVRVGKYRETKDFLIHRNIITHRSAFEREALKGQWKEAKSGIVPMPEDEPHVFVVYQQWLYTGCIFSDKRGSPLQERANEYETLVRCYALGEKLLDSTFKDCVIDAISSLLMTVRLFDPNLTNLVYESTPDGSPLRRLWQDIYLFCRSESWLDDLHEPSADFAIDLSRRQLSFWRGSRPQEGARVLLDRCSYHEHEQGKCYIASSIPVMDHGDQRVLSARWR